MPQYAKVQGTKVVDYKVLDASFFNNFVDSSPGAWIEVTNARKEGNYSDQKSGVFTYPPTYPSWTLNASTNQWEAPKTEPSDGKYYDWDDTAQNWKEITK